MFEEEASNEVQEQMPTKQNENEGSSLKSKIFDLETHIENTQMCGIVTDNSIASLLDEKEQLKTDLKGQKRHNESLAQQLKREKEYYRKEQKQFHKEMCKANERKKHHRRETQQNRMYSSTKFESEEVKTLTKLRQENERLKKMLSSEANITLSICMKFQRIKKHKDFVQIRLLELEKDIKRITTYLENLLKDNKQEINSASVRCFSEHIHKKDSLFLETNQRNHLLVLENLALKSQCQELQTSLRGNSSRKKTKASESESWLPKKLISCNKKIPSCHAFKSMKKDDPQNTESFCDAAILDVATAYVSRLTPSMLERKHASNGKIIRRRTAQHCKNQRTIHNGHKNMMIRTRSSPFLADVQPTKLASRN